MWENRFYNLVHVSGKLKVTLHT